MQCSVTQTGEDDSRSLPRLFLRRIAPQDITEGTTKEEEKRRIKREAVSGETRRGSFRAAVNPRARRPEDREAIEEAEGLEESSRSTNRGRTYGRPETPRGGIR